MKNILIRGISREFKHSLERFVSSGNLSMNQTIVKVLISGIQRHQRKKEEKRCREEAIRRIDEIREEIYQKHGWLDDSTKYIRQDRDSR